MPFSTLRSRCRPASSRRRIRVPFALFVGALHWRSDYED